MKSFRNILKPFTFIFLIFFLQQNQFANVSRPFVSIDRMLRLIQGEKWDSLRKIALDQDAFRHGKLQFRDQNYRAYSLHKEISFTFDLNDKLGNLKYILETLRKHKVKATFFVTGLFLRKYPDWTRRIVSEGHEVANHTFNHVYFRNVSQLRREIISAEKLFHKITGYYMAPYWRSPFFQEDSRRRMWMVKEARRLGYIHFNTTIDTKDWTLKRNYCYTKDEDFVRAFKKIDLSKVTNRTLVRFCRATVKRLLKKQNSAFDARSSIILMHSYSRRKENNLIYQLDNLLDFLKKQGYAVVSLSELMDTHKRKI